MSSQRLHTNYLKYLGQNIEIEARVAALPALIEAAKQETVTRVHTKRKKAEKIKRLTDECDNGE